MNRIMQMVLLTGLTAAAVCGCSSPPAVEPGQEVASRLPSTPPIVRQSVQAVGGVDRWAQISSVRAVVLMTVYDEQARPYVNRFHVRVEFGPDLLCQELLADAMTAEGRLHVEVRRVGQAGPTAGPVPDDLKRRLNSAFRVLLHSLSGPWNLTAPGVQTAPQQRTRLAGEELLRVERTDSRPTRTFYFLPVEALPRAVVTGPSQPGRAGTVTLLDYTLQPNGLAWPGRVQLFHRGEHTTLGEQPLFDAKISDVRFGRGIMKSED